MKSITFIGDPRDGDGPQIISMWGMMFEKGRAEMCDDAAIVAKAEGNSHFEVKAKRGRKANDPDSE